MKKMLSLLLALAALLTLLTGCGASAGGSASSTAQAPMVAADTAASDSSDYGYYYEENGYEYPEEDIVEEESAAAGGGAAANGGNVFPEGVKIIYTADMYLETTGFDAAAEQLSRLVSETGGYFEMSSIDNFSSYRSGYYVVRVPSEKFRSFCDQVGQICQLRSKSESAENISERYYDTQSRLETQQAKLKRLQELLSQAEDMEDIITIESAISETEYEIEQLSGTLRHYDVLVGYATVNISLNEVAQLSTVEEPPIGFAARMAAAFRNGSENFAQTVQDFLIGLAFSWVAVLLLLVIAVAVFLLVRRARRRAKERMAASDWQVKKTDAAPPSSDDRDDRP